MYSFRLTFYGELSFSYYFVIGKLLSLMMGDTGLLSHPSRGRLEVERFVGFGGELADLRITSAATADSASAGARR